jgi:RNA polymerase sigma-70 factor (ECF subfamily)
VNSAGRNETDGESGWDEWLARHAPRLLLFARQQARCEADAFDLVQEAIVEALRRATNGSPPAPGLAFATIRRRAIDLARSENRRANREAVVQQDAPRDWFDPAAEDRERARLLQEAMRNLPETQRDVITLKIWGELTFAEIAEALDIPANTAASRYRYGLEELRKLTKETLA